MFFDGAARGNPGPAAAGAVVIEIHWASAQLLGCETNNVAEFQALLHGLAYCRSAGLHNLTVVGDSRFIIDALRLGRRPVNAALVTLFLIAHHLRGGFQHCRWRHHRRSFNRMADSLANWALDNRCSATFHHPHPVPTSVLQFLSSDVWAASPQRLPIE
ncbi:TPA: hypothetical protein N0F65_001958 [Lagenidium giganteum]|uniref:RNase H type-1 domain-containing protein n=1 Tax=Lagenidium giganteum TaxID=4803 RepID=A0AAV2YNX4_9STRA|nr:TPA: hypothetical protein N0F65_001958 [Lagenidium giganteum]